MVIYQVVDKKTGKAYIGKTSRDFLQRKTEHIKLLKKNKHHNPYLQNIFNKDQLRLKFSILEKGIKTEEELNLKEIKWIEKTGQLNIHTGGAGGDTLSKHPNKEKIFDKRGKMYPPPKGELNYNYKHLTVEEEDHIENIWKSLKVPYLKEVSNLTGYSTYICKRTLVKRGISIPNKYETQKRLLKEGINTGSRNPNFTKEQKDYIRKRYVEDWVSCNKIAKELGFKSESPILKVIKELGVLKTSSEWTRYKNKNRKYKKYGKNKNA